MVCTLMGKDYTFKAMQLAHITVYEIEYMTKVMCIYKSVQKITLSHIKLPHLRRGIYGHFCTRSLMEGKNTSTVDLLLKIVQWHDSELHLMTFCTCLCVCISH